MLLSRSNYDGKGVDVGVENLLLGQQLVVVVVLLLVMARSMLVGMMASVTVTTKLLLDVERLAAGMVI